MFTKIPNGFVKLPLELNIISTPDAAIIENYVLRSICRDYYILYRKTPLTHSPDLFLFEFWCQSGKECQISYNLGIKCQVMLEFYTQKGMVLESHVVSEPFPESIQVKLKIDEIKA